MSETGYANPQSLVSTEWLRANLRQPDLRIVDATYYLPMQGGDARAEYLKQHIPGALFFDIDDIADTTSALPHMLPAPEKFASRIRKLGIGDGNRIVVYDAQGMMSAARVWWMFRIFGAREVAILDGGLPKWLNEGGPVEDGQPVQPQERHFTARLDNTQVRQKEQLLRNLNTKREQVLDARGAGRFNATEPEIWPGRRSGHIPGSKNLPYTQLLNSDMTFKPAADLRNLYQEAGIDLARPVVTSCGSGITACVLAFGLHLIGHRDVAVYDGSWAEWGLPGDTPVEP